MFAFSKIQMSKYARENAADVGMAIDDYLAWQASLAADGDPDGQILLEDVQDYVDACAAISADALAKIIWCDEPACAGCDKQHD